MGKLTDFIKKHLGFKTSKVAPFNQETHFSAGPATPELVIRRLSRASAEATLPVTLPGAVNTMPQITIEDVTPSPKAYNPAKEYKPSDSEAGALAAMLVETDTESLDEASSEPEQLSISGATALHQSPLSKRWKSDVMLARTDLERSRFELKRLMKEHRLVSHAWQDRAFNLEDDDVETIKTTLIKAGANAFIVDSTLASVKRYSKIFHQRRDEEFAKLASKRCHSAPVRKTKTSESASAALPQPQRIQCKLPMFRDITIDAFASEIDANTNKLAAFILDLALNKANDKSGFFASSYNNFISVNISLPANVNKDQVKDIRPYIVSISNGKHEMIYSHRDSGVDTALQTSNMLGKFSH